MPYAKLHSQIVNSSIWSEDSDTCKVWITLLALSDKEGFIFGSPTGLARIAALPVEKVIEVLEKFKGPDGHSSDLRSNPENQGRRIVETGSGWQLVNYEHYRNLKDADEQRDLAKQRKRKQRDRDRHKYSVTTSDGTGQGVTSPQMSRNVTPSEAEAEAEAEPKREGRRLAPPTLSEVESYVKEKGYHFSPSVFVAYYAEREWKGKDGRKIKNWHRQAATWEAREGDLRRGRESVEAVANGVAPSNPHGLRLSKDGSSIGYRGDWFHRHRDGKRWLTEDNFRPDGSSVQYDDPSPKLNAEIYDAMNKLAERKP